MTQKTTAVTLTCRQAKHSNKYKFSSASALSIKMNPFASKFVISALNGDDMLKNYLIKCLALFIPCVMSYKETSFCVLMCLCFL